MYKPEIGHAVSTYRLIFSEKLGGVGTFSAAANIQKCGVFNRFGDMINLIHLFQFH